MKVQTLFLLFMISLNVYAGPGVNILFFPRVYVTPDAAPTGVTANISNTVSRQIDVSWTINDTNAEFYNIYRAPSSTLVFIQVGQTTKGTNTLADKIGPPNTSFSYVYKVSASNAPGYEIFSSVSSTLATPASPTSTAAPTCSSITASSITINWNDRSANEWGFRVSRRIGPTGLFSVQSPDLPATSGTTNPRSWTQTSDITSGTTYYYRIDAFGWSGVVNGAVSVACTTP